MDGTVQSGTNGENINRLRNELKNEYIVSFFKNPDHLANLVVSAVETEIHKNIIDLNVKVPKSTAFKGKNKYFTNRQKNIATNRKTQRDVITFIHLKMELVEPLLLDIWHISYPNKTLKF